MAKVNLAQTWSSQKMPTLNKPLDLDRVASLLRSIAGRVTSRKVRQFAASHRPGMVYLRHLSEQTSVSGRPSSLGVCLHPRCVPEDIPRRTARRPLWSQSSLAATGIAGDRGSVVAPSGDGARVRRARPRPTHRRPDTWNSRGGYSQ